MTQEQSFILEILSDHQNKKKTEKPDSEMNWAVVYDVANIHEVTGIVFYQCKEFIPKEYFSLFQKAYSSTLFFYANRTSFLKQLNSKMTDIPFFYVKGESVAPFYPVPALRTMGDTDIYVHSEDREKVHEIMVSYGFQNDLKPLDCEWRYIKNGLEFEIHDRLIYPEAVNKASHEAFFNNFWQYVKNSELDWNFHFLYLILHLRKHLMNSGVGFRQFMDIAVVTLYIPNLNWHWIEGKLQELELLQFTKRVFALNQRWFGVSSPIKTDEITDEFYAQATKHIFNNGVFGFENKENQMASVVNNSKAGKNPFVLAIQRVFPPYSTMLQYPYLSFLKKVPILLPVGWAIRIFKELKNNGLKTARDIAKKSKVSQDIVEKRSKMYDDWGL